MRSLTKFLILITFYSCGNSHVDRQYQSLKDENPDSLSFGENTIEPEVVDPEEGIEVLNEEESTIEETARIEPCDNEIRYYIGKLQLIPIPKDSGVHYFGQCNSTVDYDLIWIDCKRERKEHLSIDAKNEYGVKKMDEITSKNGALFVPGFKTIYFQLPLGEVEDEFTDSPYTIFPCDVNVGVGTSKEDFKIVERKKGVKDFVEYNLLRYKWSLIIEKECAATD